MITIIRIFTVLLTGFIILYRGLFPAYDYMITTLLLLGFVLNFMKNQLFIDIISNYFFWILMTSFIVLFKQKQGFPVSMIYALPLVYKLLVLVYNYLKFQKYKVPTTIISKMWISAYFLCLSEITLNSTQLLMNSTFVLGIISASESLLFVIRESR